MSRCSQATGSFIEDEVQVWVSVKERAEEAEFHPQGKIVGEILEK